jgi:hypothetical protein
MNRLCTVDMERSDGCNDLPNVHFAAWGFEVWYVEIKSVTLV